VVLLIRDVFDSVIVNEDPVVETVFLISDVYDSVPVTDGDPSLILNTHVPWGFHNLQGEISILEGIGSLSAMNTFEKSGIPG